MTAVDALVITCMDARLHRADKPHLADYLRGKHIGIKTWDLVAVPGAIQALVAPDAGGSREMILKGVKVAHDLHRVSNLLLINHSDCGAYGGRAAFPSPAAEYQKHAGDLQAARKALREAYSNLDIRCLYATVEDRADGPFVTFDEVR